MNPATNHDRISIQDYLAGETLSDQRHEYVAGIVYAPAGGSNRHNAIATHVTVFTAFAAAGVYDDVQLDESDASDQ
ncbi:hypothetical protein Mal15_41350 [Stieleria maiorica]|uniref:Uncharacterized protein n=1 Tax=Stieleria maiorica TaxID=2795974 RepID=A0A5B9MJ71_9BACT|nr:hypothetical protein [Stieleria maiorica]QEG00067.1 hypothetical protein Mal15_41350 [Stieleria maiorica]